MTKIISFQWPTNDFNVNSLPYKYAIPEHEPIKLSNGSWLYSFKVTSYYEQDHPAGDMTIEEELFDQEAHG